MIWFLLWLLIPAALYGWFKIIDNASLSFPVFCAGILSGVVLVVTLFELPLAMQQQPHPKPFNMEDRP